MKRETWSVMGLKLSAPLVGLFNHKKNHFFDDSTCAVMMKVHAKPQGHSPILGNVWQDAYENMMTVMLKSSQLTFPRVPVKGHSFNFKGIRPQKTLSDEIADIINGDPTS